jgi:argininosuccinate synthase
MPPLVYLPSEAVLLFDFLGFSYLSRSFDMKNIVLAFSGGLDTSYCIPHLTNQGYNVIAATVNTGGFNADEEEKLRSHALDLGADAYHFIDAREELYDDFVSYIIKANVLRGGVYPLSAGPERYVLARKVVELADEVNADAIAHGSTGAGNDQVRFDVSVQYLDSSLDVIAPIREQELSREEEISYLREQGHEVDDVSEDYSINRGFLGTTIGGKETTGSWESIPEEVWPTVNSVDEAPDEPEELVLSFEDGLPVQLNGESLSGLELLDALEEVGARHGYGRGYHVGDTILGVKGRIAFEAPAPLIMINAHSELEKIVLTKKQLRMKQKLSQDYGDNLHEGQYFDPVMRDLEAFIDSTQQRVEGDVRIRLHKGSLSVGGVRSPRSLMDQDVAVYGEENFLWNGRDAEGFCRIYGIQSTLAKNAQLQGDQQ